MFAKQLHEVARAAFEVVRLIVVLEVAPKREVAEALNVTVRTLDRWLAHLGDPAQVGAPAVDFDVVLKVLGYIEALMVTTKPDRERGELRPYLQTIGRALGPSDPIPFMSMIQFAKPSQTGFGALLGKTFAVLRYTHKTGGIFASAMRTYVDDVTGLVVWDNIHGVPDGAAKIGGVVGFDGNYFRFTGTAKMQTTINSMVVATSQTSSENPSFLSGLALVESEDRFPLMTRVLLLRQDRPIDQTADGRFGPQTWRLPPTENDQFLQRLSRKCALVNGRDMDKRVKALRSLGLVDPSWLGLSPEVPGLRRAISIAEVPSYE